MTTLYDQSNSFVLFIINSLLFKTKLQNKSRSVLLVEIHLKVLLHLFASFCSAYHPDFCTTCSYKKQTYRDISPRLTKVSFNCVGITALPAPSPYRKTFLILGVTGCPSDIGAPIEQRKQSAFSWNISLYHLQVLIMQM